LWRQEQTTTQNNDPAGVNHMALEFTETAPGVHTATLSDPKTGQSRNIAIIESCDAWQLFIDGEIAARDLPSFAAAIEQGKKSVGGRSPRLMGISGMVVLGTFAGALAIGSAMLAIPFSSGPAEGRATPTAATTTRTAATRLAAPTASELAPSDKTSAPAILSAEEPTTPEFAAPAAKPLAKPALAADLGPGEPVKTTASNTKEVSQVPKKAIVAETPNPAPAVPAASIIKPAARLFSAENPVLGKPASSSGPLRAKEIIAPEKAATAPTTTPAQKDETANAATIENATATIETSTSKPEVEATPPAPVSNESKPDATETQPITTASIAPPLPSAAPQYDRPLIRSAAASPESTQSNETQVTQEQGAAPESGTKEAAQNDVAEPKKITRQRLERMRSVKRSRSKSNQHSRAAAKYQSKRAKRRTIRRVRTVENTGRRPARSMSCFANICRWR
jgi:hypothetical protein